MFNSLLEANIEKFSGGIVFCLFIALALGILISITYIFTHRESGYPGGFTVTLIVFPVISAMMISLVSDYLIAAAFIVAGAIGFLRFRSVPGHSRDLAHIFISLVAGFVCGLGYVFYAGVFVVMVCTVITVLYLIKYPFIGETNLQLKIALPENVDFEGLFDDIIKEYTDSYAFRKVRTVEFGSLFEVTYEITLKPNASRKEFLDKIRCRNNNLSVSISVKESMDIYSF